MNEQMKQVKEALTDEQILELAHAHGLPVKERGPRDYPWAYKGAIVEFARSVLSQQAAEPADLNSIERYRLQMAGISTAALGYWKEGDGIHPDYDTPALHDVAALYAKYDELYKQVHDQPAAAAGAGPRNDTPCMRALRGELPLVILHHKRTPETDGSTTVDSFEKSYSTQKLPSGTYGLYLRPPAEAQAAPVADDRARYFTAVFRAPKGWKPEDEIMYHPNFSAASWSHALDDRDAARAALSQQPVVRVPEGFAVKHVDGHGWLIDPPSGGRWVAFDGTPAGDFFNALAAAPMQEDSSNQDRGAV